MLGSKNSKFIKNKTRSNANKTSLKNDNNIMYKSNNIIHVPNKGSRTHKDTSIEKDEAKEI